MGGKAFESDDIATPRMPTKTYREVLEKVEKALSHLFENVAHAIEGPEKTSHGDLDVLIVPYPNTPVPSVQTIASLLGAIKWTQWQGNGIAQFAIPWPKDDEDSQSTEKPLEDFSKIKIRDQSGSTSSKLPGHSASRGKLVKKCIQLDLNRFSSLQDMRWQLFNTAHGDLCNILSNMVRSKGFTINTEALYLRIASVEKFHRKAGRIQLSRDPEQVLEYFGLDTTRFWQPFDTLDEMMEFAATSRFFLPERQRITNPEASLNWTDQKYLNSRPIFKYWVDTFLPAHKDDKPGTDAHLTREEVLKDVYTFFGDHIEATYEAQRHKGEQEIARQFLWQNVRSAIREDDPNISEEDMNDAIKAFKRVAQYHLRSDKIEYTTIHDAFTREDYNAVITWSAKEYNKVLTAYRAGELEDLSLSMDPRHQGRASAHDVETYTAEDDETIKRMKVIEKATWPEILKALDKKSKSQLQEHWKRNLQDTVA